ncbi:MAG: transporter substrate-binding domain-containing protein [Opitutae bacterium]|nr:transporter substrate-binding domain-containing protein [Opitutae bacterium]
MSLADAAAEAEAARSYKVAVESAGEPFSLADDTGRATGFAVELLRAAARDQRLALEFEVAPWPVLIAQFQQGRFDILSNVSSSPGREAFMDFSMPNLVQHGGLFARRDGPALRTPADLAGKRVAVLRDSLGHDYARQQAWGATLVPVLSLAEGIEDLRAGRVDALLGLQLVTTFRLRERGYRDVVLTAVNCDGLSYRMHFGVHPGQADLLSRLNEGLLAVHMNGTYDRLHEKWIGPLEPRRLRFRDVRPYLLPAALLALALLTAFAWQRRVLRRVSRQTEELRRSEERLSLVFEGSQDAFWDWDVPADRVQRSPRWAAMLGYAPAELGTTVADFFRLVHPDDRPAVEADHRAVLRERDQFANEFRLRAKSGEWRWILDRGKVVVRDPATRAPLRITGTHSDITDRKRAEAETARLQSKMLETQKLESLGVLAGGIAHDFNNLLTVILGNTALVRLDARLAPESTGRLDNILAASHRAADLCRQLLAYAGKASFAPSRVHLNAVVEETTRLLELSLPRTAVLEFALAAPLPAIEADLSQIRQVVMNLVLNAAEALGGQPGKIRLETQPTRLAAEELSGAQLLAATGDGEYVRLEIADTGGGMTPDVLEKIFDPFFSTKFAGRGLGLAAVLGIVRSHQGALKVTSAAGRGTVFRVYFPALAGAPAEPPRLPPPAAAARPRPGGAVLVVDDETPVRELVTEVLRAGGYDPVSAADGQTAIEIFRAQPDRFVCVLIDLTMPGLDGPRTLGELRKLRPGVVGIIMSGYSEQDARVALTACGADDFIQKPFTPELLFARLAAAAAKSRP